MKSLTIFAISLLVLSVFSVGCAKKDTAWSVCESCSNPESVYYDEGSKTLYVSNIAGAGDEKDGKGWISKLSPNGKTISGKWVVGLNAPKGMRSLDGILWVTDIDEVVAIDMKSGRIIKRIKIDGAKFLNDIAVSPDGTIYVSDTVGGAIYRIKDDRHTIYMQGEQLESPNGLLYRDGRLHVAAWGKGLAKDWSTKSPGGIYYIVPKTKKIYYITKEPLGNLDGLEIDRDGNFIVSDWVAGKVYRVDRWGKSKLLRSGAKGFADIAFVPGLNLIVVPEMLENKITAFN